jgi:WD40 repeat protein
MIKRPLTGMSVLGLTLSASLWAAPLFQVPQTPGGPGNPKTPQPKPERRVMKEARVAAPDRRALCLAISPDGGTLAAGCSDGLVHLLGPLSGERRITLAGVQRGYVRGVAFVPAGKTIAAISDDRQLRLWDTGSGRMLNELRALGESEEAGLPSLSPSALAISPDGGQIAVGGAGTADGKGVIRPDDTTYFQVQVRDTKTQNRMWSHLRRRTFLVQLAFSPDGMSCQVRARLMLRTRLLRCRRSAGSRLSRPRVPGGRRHTGMGSRPRGPLVARPGQVWQTRRYIAS